MKSLNLKQLKLRAQEILSKARNHKPALILAIIVIVSIVIAAVIYQPKWKRVRTYYIAYIGKYKTPTFDRLHEIAIRKYLDELDTQLTDGKLELKRYDINDYAGDSAKFYQEIAEDPNVVLVIDNTWGSDFQKSVNIIRDNQIPVININADKSVADYGKNVVFFGQDDGVPRRIVIFCAEILKAEEAIFIAEQDYPLTNKFRKELAADKVAIREIPVSTSEPNDNDRQNLLNSLEAELNKRKDQPEGEKKRVVVLNTHQQWGNEIINHIETHYRDVVILGGSYIINGSKYESAYGRFDQSNKGNSLIMLNAPSDAVSQKIHNDFNDLKKIKYDAPVGFDDLKARLYVKRCLDAVSLINFFHSLAGGTYVCSDEVYTFDNDLLSLDERPFELRTRGQITSYPNR